MGSGMDVVELARIWRGPVVESIHHGVVAVADTQGRLVEAWGDPDWLPTPRSSLKPFQAVALVESGAADALRLTDSHIALACASHHAQPFQVELVKEWLRKLDLTEDALVCGPALPRNIADQATAFALGGPRRIFHNCSGKHCGFLTVAKHLGAGLDYGNPDHPAQRLYMEVLTEFTGLAPGAIPLCGDGCALPAAAVPIAAMARAMARLGVAEAGTPKRRDAAKRVVAAMAAHPDNLASKDSSTARLIRRTGGNVVCKGGAEGYVVASIRDKGLGIAIKVADGDPEGRAKMGVLARLLGRLGVLPVDQAEALVADVAPRIADSNGSQVGRVEITIERPLR